MITARKASAIFLIASLFGSALAAGPDLAPPPRPVVNLSGYRTVKQAIAANQKEFRSTASGISTAAGYLGIAVADKNGKPAIEAVEPDSPADKAGIRPGDIVVLAAGEVMTAAPHVRDILRGKLAGDVVDLVLSREGRVVPLSVTLIPASKPMSSVGAGRPILGVVLSSGRPSLDEISSGGPADRAGLKVGDVLLQVDGTVIDSASGLRDALGNKRPGDRIDLLYERNGKRGEVKVTLMGEGQSPTGPKGSGGWDDRIPSAWKKPSYRLAVLGVEYPDVKHNAKIHDEDWEESLFSIGTYNDKSATGFSVHGSMNDYYKEISHGTFKIDGKFIGWVEASKKRMEYSSGSGTSTKEKASLLTESLDLYVKKNGKDSLKEFDGIFFIYAGERVQTTRGGLYWPHRANVSHNGKRWPYFIVQEGGSRMTDISVFCHEFGHMIGLPDLYARPELPGSEGVGVWCAMSNQVGGGKPQHFCAWSKEQLGWVKPVVLDPRVKQKLILGAVEDSPNECYKVMCRPDGSEYFLLENRRKKGFDASLPAEGLLIWRVLNNRPILEESHGVEGATGPRVFLGSVPYPSQANNSFTPFTIPSSKSQLGGGLPVYITNIRRLPDGRITFHIGYEYQ